VQNMNLLVSADAPLSENQNSHTPIVEKDALVSEAGPSGSNSSISIHQNGGDMISIYVVHSGDTLSQIADMFGVSVNTIKWGNNLTSNTLKEGQTLVILPISGVKHTVVKGDTIDSLAKKYKGDIDEILAYNNLQRGAKLTTGTEIIIPDGEVVAPPTAKSVSYPKSSGLKEYAGYYLRPIVGGVKTQGIHGYNGVDLASSYGSAILASADGEVIISKNSGWNGGYGDYIVVKHANGTQTLYAHLSQSLVSVGQAVKQGDIIGAMGSTGKATGVHLHFEIRGAKNPF